MNSKLDEIDSNELSSDSIPDEDIANVTMDEKLSDEENNNKTKNPFEGLSSMLNNLLNNGSIQNMMSNLLANDNLTTMMDAREKYLESIKIPAQNLVNEIQIDGLDNITKEVLPIAENLKLNDINQLVDNIDSFKRSINIDNFQSTLQEKLDNIHTNKDINRVRHFLNGILHRTPYDEENLINSATKLSELLTLEKWNENKETDEVKQEIRNLYEYYFRYKIEDMGRRMEASKKEFLDNCNREFTFDDLLQLNDKQF